MISVETVTLFRPVGLEELELIKGSGWKAFPPRLPDQPIFYPVTNEGYAAQIARDWNTKTGSRHGYVTRFEVNANYVAGFDRKVVGGREHEELWVPAEELEEFNRNIVGSIMVTQQFLPAD
ncbi:ADP-ribosylation/crystallin J1 [Pararhizobium sp. BT-229]|uniref:ADP-ribosylation/crystallin J1 n=1 Tax=Pararhizobium sp. BT-229 TaxID=2986923 RepID=UPI0021F75DA7|nr:ADP-ribosylation/crystallin J1 [Pararhizobium sp. BT-229]MCV9960503.1 ADP-ribosylation/crystallin J1 [Pararhizobium sp. BT-229]